VLKCVGSWSCVPISADEAIGFALKDWGIIDQPKNGKTPPRFRQRSRGNSANSLQKEARKSKPSEAVKTEKEGTQSEQQDLEISQSSDAQPFISLPDYLTSPDSVRSVASSAYDESDLESMYSDYDGDATDVEDQKDEEAVFSDEEGDGKEENDKAPTSPKKIMSADKLASPMTPKISLQSANIQQRKQSKRKYVILDCRPKNEYDECHIYGSIHLDEECWSTGEVTSVIEGFKDMKDCHFALLGSGPSSFELQMSVNAHRCGPSKGWKRKQRLKNQASNVVQSSNNFFKKMVEVTAETFKLKKDEDKFVPRSSYGEDELDPEGMQVGGTGEEDLAVSRWVCMFLQHDFQYVSYIRGGIKACVKELKRAGKPSGVGLEEGAELVLEGTAVSHADEETSTTTASGRRVWKEMVESMTVVAGGVVEEENPNERGEDSGGQSSPKNSKSRRSLDGMAKQGWNSFMKGGMAKFTAQSRTSKDTFEEAGVFGIQDDIGEGEKVSGESESSNRRKSINSDRSSELKELRGELETQLNAEASSPTRNTPQWMKRLSLKTAEAGTKFLLASQKLGEKAQKLAPGRASPRNSLLGSDSKNKDSYYLQKLVDISDFIMSETEIGENPVQTFSATRCPTTSGIPTSVMSACQILVSPRFFLALEMKISTPGAGKIVEVREMGALSKITTKANEHGLVNFHFNQDGEEVILCFIVEDFRDCIQLMKVNFKAYKEKKVRAEKAKEELEVTAKKELELEEKAKEEEEGGGEVSSETAT